MSGSSKNNNQVYLNVKTTALRRDIFKEYCRSKGITIIEAINAFMIDAPQNKVNLTIRRHRPAVNMSVKL